MERNPVHMLLVFLAGFFCSKGFDMLFVLQQTGALDRTLSNEKVRTVNVTTRVREEQKETSEDITATAPAPTSSNPRSSGFSAIVDTAYQRALKPIVSSFPRKELNIDWWEKQSQLTTSGGLSHNDRILVGKIYGKANSVFEYGLGESTYIANHVGVPRYAGIDSDPVWVGTARNKVRAHFRFYLGDVGKTGDWGWPQNKDMQKNILNYQLAPLIVEPLPFDVYMVDGRWRLPAMIASFLHASDRGAPHIDTIVLLHDCDPERNGRNEYKRADHLLNMVDHSGAKLCVYQRRPETTDEQLKELWHQYMNELMR